MSIATSNIAAAAAPASASAPAASIGSAAGSTVDDAASPHLAYMRLALAEAAGALESEEVPVGCIIVHRASGTVVATGRNETNKTKNVSKQYTRNHLQEPNVTCVVLRVETRTDPARG